MGGGKICLISPKDKSIIYKEILCSGDKTTKLVRTYIGTDIEIPISNIAYIERY